MRKSFLGTAAIVMLSVAGCSTASTKPAETTTQAQVETSVAKEEGKETKPEAFDMDIKNNALAVSPDETIAVVGNSEIPGIKVYDLKEKNVIASLDEYVTPRNIAFSKDGAHFYVSDSSYGTIRELDSKTFEVTRTFELKQGVFGFTLTKDGSKIFANNQFESTVTVIDLETGSIEKEIEGFSRPRQGIVVDSKDEFVYVTNFEGNDVRVINTQTLEIEKTLVGIPDVRAISVDQEGKYLYGASSSENTITVLDIATGEVVKTIAVGEQPYGSALSADGKTILTGEKASNQVSVIDTETLEVVRVIEGLNEPRQAIVYSSKEGEAYVLNKDLSISVINYMTGEIVAHIVE